MKALHLTASLFLAGLATALPVQHHGGADPKTPPAAGDTARTDPYPLDTCPVSGKKLGSMGDPVVKVYEGREVRFCCAMCPSTFEADPAAAWKKVDAAIVKDQMRYYPLETCVVSGEPLIQDGQDNSVSMVYGNRLVRLCCSACEREFRAAPKKFLEQLDKATADAQRKEYPLDKCLISEGELGSMGEPTERVVAGRLMRFCCAGCNAKVDRDPVKHLQRLDAAWQAKGKYKLAPESQVPAGGGQGEGHKTDGAGKKTDGAGQGLFGEKQPGCC